MTLTAEGWYSFSLVIPGPPEKQYSTPNFCQGFCLHSAEGTEPGILATLMNPTRQASWCGTVCRDGRLLQHYPVTTSCWASGNRQANTALVGWELEGFRPDHENGQGAVATPEQVATLLRMRGDWQAAGRPYLQRDNTRTLWEHREVATWVVPNAGPTACPSGRYAPFYAALQEDAMTPAERAQMDAIIKHLGGEQRIADIALAPYVDDLNAALVVQRDRLEHHIETHPAGNLNPAHTHITGGPQP